MFQEDKKILTQYGVVNINGQVMCYGMMDCCVMYWKEGCWLGKRTREEEQITELTG